MGLTLTTVIFTGDLDTIDLLLLYFFFTFCDRSWATVFTFILSLVLLSFKARLVTLLGEALMAVFSVTGSLLVLLVVADVFVLLLGALDSDLWASEMASLRKMRSLRRRFQSSL